MLDFTPEEKPASFGPEGDQRAIQPRGGAATVIGWVDHSIAAAADVISCRHSGR
jgi:hypothetical protein